MNSQDKLNQRIAATASALQAWQQQDYAKALHACHDFFKYPIFDDVRNANPETREVYKQLFDMLDDVIQKWWLNDNTTYPFWQKLMLPIKDQFEFTPCIMMPLWLRYTASNKLVYPLNQPDLTMLKSAPLAKQAKIIGQFCLRCDSLTPLDYQNISEAISSKLQPFFTFWFLSTYLCSPYSFTYELANTNRAQSVKQFVSHHQHQSIPLPLHALINNSGYRAAYYLDLLKPFLTVLTEKVFSPHIKKQTKGIIQTKINPHTSKLAIMLTGWHENHALYRCLSPLLESIKDKGELYGIYPNVQAQDKPIAASWSNKLSFITLPDKIIQNTNHTSFDFIYYPEVGLTPESRLSAMTRLGYVQATGYGHPATTGLSTMDYYIGGNAVETDGQDYSEQLILLPGLGVSSTPPPKPETERTRPLKDSKVLIFNLSSFDKLNASLLTLWNDILQHTKEQTQLQLYPAMSENLILYKADQLNSLFKNSNVNITPLVPRQHIINDLVEADLYLDSFPFGGFNTLIEVLASGCPVVTYETHSARGRFGAAMLRMLKLPDFLIAHSKTEYMDAATKLIKDAVLRKDIRQMLSREYVLETLCDPKMKDHFEAAVQYMCAHPRPDKTGKIIYIEAGAQPIFR